MPSALESGRYKVVVVGPTEAGKSTMSNVLAEASEVASESYRPTVGCRILEFESSARSGMTVELWDCSGDPKGQKVWPALKKDAVGCMLVYNPEKPNHEQEIEQWWQWFPRNMNMTPNQVLVVQSLRRSDMPRRMPLPAKLAQAGLTQHIAVPAEDLPSIRKHFGSFLEAMRQSVLDAQRREEEEVMKAQGA